jgi:hypothetical protein
MAKLRIGSLALSVVPLAAIAGASLLPAGTTAALPAALDDPAAKRCLFMAYRRENPELASEPMTTTVENAAALFNIETVAGGFAVCRRALAAFPSEPKLIIANHTATEVLFVLLFGLKAFPKTDAEAVAKARILAEGNSATDKFLVPLTGVLLGSAYEYGIGADKDRGEALKWYRLAADAGSKAGKEELERLSPAGKE